jgi:CDGSH-type Zn-finger protein
VSAGRPVGAAVEVTPCGDGGPVLVRGADHVVDEDGRSHAVERPVVALCACDRSQRMPWCDGTHRAVQRARRKRAALAAGGD